MTERTSFPVITMPLLEAMIAHVCKSAGQKGNWSKWGIARAEDDVLVGTCGFNDWSSARRWAEIAFDLAQEEWGKGMRARPSPRCLHGLSDRNRRSRSRLTFASTTSALHDFLNGSDFCAEGCLRSFRICRGAPHDFQSTDSCARIGNAPSGRRHKRSSSGSEDSTSQSIDDDRKQKSPRRAQPDDSAQTCIIG